ncbi:hypothetical protein [Leifsonia sp. ALI-44-B]|uniref:hypothetical protein n=1 Tax=Leifsonia sp. ALI-44-B TaxID=1933776 RepID=UPI0015C2CFA0|nr:hypothetical protein [Leifsonia sp. ALI-44-B]
MASSTSVGQPRIGLAAGAIIFATMGVLSAVQFFSITNAGESPPLATTILAILGLTSAALFAYWAASLGSEKKRLSRRDWVLTLILAAVSGSALSVAAWVIAGS